MITTKNDQFRCRVKNGLFQYGGEICPPRPSMLFSFYDLQFDLWIRSDLDRTEWRRERTAGGGGRMAGVLTNCFTQTVASPVEWKKNGMVPRSMAESERIGTLFWRHQRHTNYCCMSVVQRQMEIEGSWPCTLYSWLSFCSIWLVDKS